MDLQFARELMERTGFPEEASASLLAWAETLARPGMAEEFRMLVYAYGESGFRADAVQARVDALAKTAGIHPYSLWLLLLIECAGKAKPLYHSKGVHEEVFWDTFRDLKYKLLECRENYGVWGNFVAFWYDIFFRADIVKLGRLEYERCRYQRETPYSWGDITVRNGDPVLSIHIPSSAEPFDRGAVLESLGRAHAFFGRDVLVCECHSWLLYPGYEELWPAGGNVRGFREMFDILQSWDSEGFGDGWRVFGSAYGGDPAALPEKSAMQRAFKKHILAGGKHGDGFGLLLFDGRKILNR